ncbi:hypothetical protein [Gloeocapsopsis dulcis]|uniref:Uncharacterized protein n=1 Tax=Gloeocapsopsis dulcis AAB1 = 1H9 TaxID=1433147 RepID=A0A6N8FRD2_9CHRO|nr:hypothetical protein [Gloeocapsopsis dulcis]MUL35700.1 hypothetical protein [Gloeocapsopsis dulcis AAB1 = 1H9]WNN91017.1 hypothetical protein P0S91_08055 [Gloeocapsopsis dulcis]
MATSRWSILGAFSLSCWGIIAAPAVAEMKRIDHTLRSEPNQTFTTLMQEAEALATTLVEQGFTEDNVTEVSVNILGERHGQQVPLLSSRVSRTDWQKQLGIQHWTRYFRTSGVLLGFFKPEEPNQSPLSAFPNPTSESTLNPTSGDSSIQQPALPPGIPPSIQQSIPTSPSATPDINNNTQQITIPSAANSPSPDDVLRGASPEESDPGYR